MSFLFTMPAHAQRERGGFSRPLHAVVGQHATKLLRLGRGDDPRYFSLKLDLNQG
jgi:hypothetical protein